MAKKENKGGILSNEQIEEDLRAKGRTGQRDSYSGAQDNGDRMVRATGNEVQQRDGFAEETQQGEED